VAALQRSRRILKETTLEAVGGKLVRALGQLWLGLPARNGTWKLWAIDDQGKPRLDDYGKLIRRNTGPASLIVSPALRANGSIPQVQRVLDLEGESDLLSALDARVEYALTGTAGATSLKGHEAHADWLQELAPAEAIVVRDRDESGCKGAQAAAAWWLARGVPVRVVELPEALGKAGDLRDYLNGRPARPDQPATEPLGDAAALQALIEATPLRSPVDRRGAPAGSGGAAWAPPSRLLEFRPLGEMLAEPEVETEWLVEELLPRSGISALVAKPKVGKSTFSRALALAVARGEPFLGHEARQDLVFYLALEDKPSQVTRHFRAMGASGEEPVRIFAGIAPQDAVAQLVGAARLERPDLIIVDTLQRLARVRDLNDYSGVTLAIEPLLQIARETGAHLLFTHHGKKNSNGEVGDSILGSTAIFGSVDTALFLRRTESHRLLSTRQRYGADLEESVVELDPTTRRPRLAGSKLEVDEAAAAQAIVNYLGNAPERVAEAGIEEAVEVKTAVLRRALRGLVERGRVLRQGRGRKGDPFLYALADSDSCSLVPTSSREQENQNRNSAISLRVHEGNSCSRDSRQSAQGREQESAAPSSLFTPSDDPAFTSEDDVPVRVMGYEEDL
jgi:hypothetical protein